MPVEPLQSQLDSITARTRTLVQPERLARAESFIAELFATGIEDRILPVGSPAPAFALPHSPQSALTGALTRSEDLLALGPVVIKFFRGRWCPYDITELEAWQAHYPTLRSRGALLVAISPQLPRQNDFLVQQHGLTFPVLSDVGARVASSFRLTHTLTDAMQAYFRSILVNIPFVNGDNSLLLPLPATYVVRPSSTPNGHSSGAVVFAEAHADHRVRPEPADVLATL